ncbi:hypothetical protein DPEC_G00180440, partial [Dallia pectoralis]
ARAEEAGTTVVTVIYIYLYQERKLLEASVLERTQEGSQGVCEDVATSEKDRDEEGGNDRQEAGRQEEQSEGEVREDKDEDETVERGPENSDA